MRTTSKKYGGPEKFGYKDFIPLFTLTMHLHSKLNSVIHLIDKIIGGYHATSQNDRTGKNRIPAN